MADNNDDIDNIIDALKEKNSELKKEIRKPASKENLEEYVIESASTIVNEGLDLIKNLGVFLNAAPDAKDLSAYSELINATSSAIESLNKIIVQDKKGNTLKELKKMDHEIKKDLIGDAKDMLVSTREDVFKRLIKDADVIKEEEIIEILPEAAKTSTKTGETAAEVTKITKTTALSSAAN
jgi:hypothetical protein